MAQTTNPTETDFGYRRVPLAEKQELVDGVFHSVARRYDLMNDLMSAGLHRVWKDILVAEVNPPKAVRSSPLRSRARPAAPPSGSRTFDHLDLAGGTGDVAFRIARISGARANITVADINTAMLEVGRERAEREGLDVTFTEGNAEALPFPDKSFDCVTIAFGIRNVPQIDRGLSEAYRVLKTGGRFLCLEFSAVDIPGFDRLYEAYSFNVIPAVGRAVTGDAESYRYLVESIRKFPRPAAYEAMMRDAGFRRVSHQSLTGGAVAIHSGWRL